MEVLTPTGGPVPPSSTTATSTAETGDEAGTAPGDRRFRPDVEGLRAVAIALVVLYHSGFPGVSGGYVGVDVFFVISGFVITGVLLRERSATGRTSLAHFYARRARRILPAATLVIVVTVIAAYAVVGVAAGNQTAVDSRWAEIFLANFHFAASGTNYLNANQLPSLLQNFWSLAIEEQFYLVYPTLFLLAWRLKMRTPPRERLLFGLGVVVFASFLLSVVQTSTNPATAYFSPFTRAWELALGAMVALATERLVRLPARVAGAMTWVGLAAVAYSAVAFGAGTEYPGAAVAVPVLGTALVIAGGAAVPAAGAEILLGRRPFGWLGRLSYSLYLWHWPILILAAESANRASLPFHRNLLPLTIALVASMVTYYFYETPLRHLPLMRRSRNALGFGALLVVVALLISTVALALHAAAAPAAGAGFEVGSPAQVAAAVRNSSRIQKVPSDLTPPLGMANTDWGGPPGDCLASVLATSIPASCVSGYKKGSSTMVLLGDSHAAMWAGAFNLIAGVEGWRFYDLGKGYCPAADLVFGNPEGIGMPPGKFSACTAFQQWSVQFVNRIHPKLVVITQEYRQEPDGVSFTQAQWQAGVERTIESLHVPRQDIVVLGNIPTLFQDPLQCLAENSNTVQLCSQHVHPIETEYNSAEKAAAAATGARYIDTIPWFCSSVCSPVIGHFQVYYDQFHVTAHYAKYLSAVLSRALDITPAWNSTKTLRFFQSFAPRPGSTTTTSPGPHRLQ